MNMIAASTNATSTETLNGGPSLATETAVKRVTIDRSRDALLTDFGKATMDDRYLMPGETYQDRFANVSIAYGDDSAHAQRIYDYMSKLWFMPATPVLSNGGTTRGLPISCYLNEASDSLQGIVDLWTETTWLSSQGGGIGSYWGNLRSIGEGVGEVGKTSGIMPFIQVEDVISIAVSQGSLRRGAAAAYIPVNHPEIEEFVDMRRATGGDPARKVKNLHHGILIPDAFMEAVVDDADWDLLSPKTGRVVRVVRARELWIRILTARIEMGEPYIIFSDRVHEQRPLAHKLAGLKMKASNLCSEIVLPTGTDHLGKDRTAVCCLSSLNLERWEEWQGEPMFIEDVMRFLDNVLQDFIDRAPPMLAKAIYSATRERSVGLGVMGFHSMLQAKGVPFEGVMASVWNRRVFKHIRAKADEASRVLAGERGAAPDCADFGIQERFVHKMAVAPTATISIIAGNSSPGIDAIPGNAFLQKTLSGSFIVCNRHLQALLAELGQDTPAVWSSITTKKGSVQHLDFLSDLQKDVFKTAFELDQRWVIEHAGDRAPMICQSQSVNISLPGDATKRDLHQIHMKAWRKGLKSLYYCRSTSIRRAEVASDKVTRKTPKDSENPENGKECLSCQ